MTRKYLTDRDPDEARRRLSLNEKIQDPTTIRLLLRIGIHPGLVCLEAGGGGGSIAAWLCEHMGDDGKVVACDIETGFLDLLDHPNLEVLQHDLVTDDLPEATFDIVHARDVLVHIPERTTVLGKLANAVKPGGWILLEEPDASSVMPDPLAPEDARRLFSTVMTSIYAFLSEKGLDPYCGARLVGMLRDHGFDSIESEAVCRTFHGGGAAARSPHVFAFSEIRELLVETGAVSAVQFEEFMELFEDPGFSWREDLTVSVWGRRGVGGG